MNRWSERLCWVGALLVLTTAATLAGWRLLPHTSSGQPPPLTAEVALDAARAVANYKQETLTKFDVKAIVGPYVRVVISVPEESMVDLPVDAVYAYDCVWHLVRTEPVRGKLPGPG